MKPLSDLKFPRLLEHINIKGVLIPTIPEDAQGTLCVILGMMTPYGPRVMDNHTTGMEF